MKFSFRTGIKNFAITSKLKVRKNWFCSDLQAKMYNSNNNSEKNSKRFHLLSAYFIPGTVQNTS